MLSGPACFGAVLYFGLTLTVAANAADAGRKVIEPDAATGTALAVVVDPVPLAHTAQVYALDEQGRMVGARQQVEQVLKNLAGRLVGAKSSLNQIVKINIYLRHQETVPEVQRVLGKTFRGPDKPAVCYVVGTLAHPDALVAMDAIALTATRAGQEVTRRQGCAVLPPGPVVYVSGQAEKGDLLQATRRTMASLKATLDFLGLNPEQVVQLKAFLQPMTRTAEVEKEIAAYFPGQPAPPVVFVEWISSLPIEIELIAAAGPPRDGADAVEFLTPPGLAPSPVYSRIARINRGKRVYVSGLYGTSGGTGQVQEMFGTLGRLLDTAGSDFRHLAKATYYVIDDDASKQLNTMRPKVYDPKRPPAASKATVASVGRPGRTITFDMIAVSVK